MDKTRPNVPRAFRQARTRPIQVRRHRRRRSPARLLAAVLTGALIGLALSIFIVASSRSNVLLLGIDRAPEGTWIGRSDTMIITSVRPYAPNIGLLSLPRDLWVQIEGVGANRINTAHYFAEANQSGAGPAAAMRVVESNFGVPVELYVRINFATLQEFVDAIGGVPVVLDEPTAGLPPGEHFLEGEAALAFVRSRIGDDFFRIRNGQIFLRSVVRRVISPQAWPGLPEAAFVLTTGIDTNIPIWHWPGIAAAVLLTGPEGVDGRTITRDMVQGFTTQGGAQVLQPNWEMILPLTRDVLG